MKYVRFNSPSKLLMHGLILEQTPDLVYSLDLETGFLCHSETYHWDNLEDLFPWLMEQNLEELSKTVEKLCPSYPLADCSLLAPFQTPRHDVICVGLNYKDHVTECHKELDFVPPEDPTYFSKRASRIYSHGDTLPSWDGVDAKVDYEVELAVIIGKSGKNIPENQVKDHILGYAVYNDFSARTVQKETTQWYRGKSLDGLSAMSAGIVLAQGVSYPPALPIKSYVNEELRQSSNTDNLIHSIDYLISRFSQGLTLEVGDIILTGTPAGVGMGMNPPQFLNSGDIVTCEIEGIGTLTNHVG